MNVLAIETSSAYGSVALARGKEMRKVERFFSPQRHSESLTRALIRLELESIALDKILIGLGPGSFTSIRVGLAMAYGLALVKGCEVWGVWSHYSQGRQMRHVTRLILVTDARRGCVYVTEYERGKLYRATYMVRSEELDNCLSKGTLAATADWRDERLERIFPRAEDYLDLYDDPNFQDWQRERLEPFYLPIEKMS
ncbi:MAG: tRNA (adenosine(37)-N6)-threonylcarbamoyltransferase complex dimerization subunit type 1 TsaB [Methylacidiphilales bacterium]|nr:tRNA (adenosine(37)-N6)-threonylcarbamoyltransferase complex dimerization subunit type 1 TsaB [Candidatus Methylacidiphilales bacterium]MDW8349227.1 tRNA (adenosine(37)-N6)-threonylcarbamoyltransferase complex dimerization subunit type 1 TsaB [Verrucomicrobiae bacterium]